MKLLAKSDIKHGAGICVLDPHGDLVDSILTFIPKERIQDVIIFDPSDLEYPLTFNPFSGISNSYRMQFVTSFIEIFKKRRGKNNDKARFYKKSIGTEPAFYAALRIHARRFHLRVVYRYRNDCGEQDSGRHA